MRLAINFFATEASYDFLYIYDGYSVDVPSIASLSGYLNTPMVFDTTQQYMFLKLYSDYVTTDGGFTANYSSVTGK